MQPSFIAQFKYKPSTKSKAEKKSSQKAKTKCSNKDDKITTIITKTKNVVAKLFN